MPFSGGYLTYYVGETGRSFLQRFTEHTTNYLWGLYRIYDSSEFLQGQKKLVWGGMWKERNNPNDMYIKLLDFLSTYEGLSQSLHKFLGTFRIFLVPIEAEERIRQRIETAIAKWLLNQEGVIGQFQDNDIVYKKRLKTKTPIKVAITSTEQILGLPKELIA